MKNSSAKVQDSSDFYSEDVDYVPIVSATSSVAHVRPNPPSLENSGIPPSLYAATAREAGRVNARNTSEEEYQRLLSERQKLLDKKFSGTITRQESNRLTYVRWSLDMIDDARHGHVLDALQAGVERYEAFLSDLSKLREDLNAKKQGHRR